MVSQVEQVMHYPKLSFSWRPKTVRNKPFPSGHAYPVRNPPSAIACQERPSFLKVTVRKYIPGGVSWRTTFCPEFVFPEGIPVRNTPSGLNFSWCLFYWWPFYCTEVQNSKFGRYYIKSFKIQLKYKLIPFIFLHNNMHNQVNKITFIVISWIVHKMIFQLMVPKNLKRTRAAPFSPSKRQTKLNSQKIHS